MDHNQAFMMKVHWPIGYHPLKDRICSSELQSWRRWQLKSGWLIITMDHNHAAVHSHFLWKLKKKTDLPFLSIRDKNIEFSTLKPISFLSGQPLLAHSQYLTYYSNSTSGPSLSLKGHKKFGVFPPFARGPVSHKSKIYPLAKHTNTTNTSSSDEYCEYYY